MLDAPDTKEIQLAGEQNGQRPCIRIQGPRWAVLATYPSAETWAEQNLRLRGYQPYLPLYATMQRDRAIPSMKHLVLRPLFQGYIFCRHDPRDPWRPIRYCPGIRANLIGGKAVQYTSDASVEALQATDAQRLLPHQPKTMWRTGAPCALADGPFSGLPAVVLNTSHDQASIAVMFLGALRQISVPLDALTARTD